MAKVYLSPSDQVKNLYAWGNTNEHEQCQRIANTLEEALRRSGVATKMAARGMTMDQRCAASNNFGADLHVCVHTNAFNGQVMGTRLFCYKIPGKGYDACKAVFRQLAPLSPGTSENIRANAELYEVKYPAAPTVYCECEFHDTVDGAKWIVEHTADIGEAIARGLCEYLKVAYVAPVVEQLTESKDVLYRVQVGAFAERANAEKLLKRLEQAGFTGFIAK